MGGKIVTAHRKHKTPPILRNNNLIDSRIGIIASINRAPEIMYSDENDFARLDLLNPTFDRCGRFSSKWTPCRWESADSNFNIGDFIACLIFAPYWGDYRRCDPAAWRRAEMADWQREAPIESVWWGCKSIHAHRLNYRISGPTVTRPIEIPRNFPARIPQRPIIVKTELEGKIKQRLSIVGEESISPDRSIPYDPRAIWGVCATGAKKGRTRGRSISRIRRFPIRGRQIDF